MDGSNTIHSSQRFEKGFKIDYKKLVDTLVGNRQLIRPYFFGSYDPDRKPSEKFYEALQFRGFEISTKPVRSRRISKGGEIYRLKRGLMLRW